VGYNALQYFVMNDCLVRGKAMGATHVLVIDFDEFVFPSQGGVDTLQAALDAAPAQAQVMSGLLFHTGLCVTNRATGLPPNHYHDFLNTFLLAQPDARQKIAVHVSAMPEEQLLAASQEIHAIRGMPNVHTSHVHMHHYREVSRRRRRGAELRG
jgi:hypothetical protein